MGCCYAEAHIRRLADLESPDRTGIVGRFTILKFEVMILSTRCHCYANRCPERRVSIPAGYPRTGRNVVEVVVDRLFGFGDDGNGDPADPDVLLAHAVNGPDGVLVQARRVASPLGNPTQVLRPHVLGSALITLGRNLAVDYAHITERDTIVAGSDGHRIAMIPLGNVNHGVAVVGCLLDPQLSAAAHDSSGNCRQRPSISLVSRLRHKAHFADTNQRAIPAVVETQRLAESPEASTYVGDLAARPVLPIVPFHFPVTQQQAVVSLFQQRLIVDCFATSCQETGVFALLVERWMARRRFDQCIDFTQPMVGSDFANIQSVLFRFTDIVGWVPAGRKDEHPVVA